MFSIQALDCRLELAFVVAMGATDFHGHVAACAGDGHVATCAENMGKD
jgi:hypothetical protein